MVKNMKQKLPIENQEDLELLERIAKNRFGEESDAYKSFMIFRYTGCHVSVLINPKYELHEEKDEEGDIIIIWQRPKKKGAWARTPILKHSNIDFDINKFATQVQKRKKKIKRLYWYRLMVELGEKSGIKLKEPLSPNTLRHTLGVELLNKGWEEVQVAQLLNVSRKTLEWYARFTDKGMKAKLKKTGW